MHLDLVADRIDYRTQSSNGRDRSVELAAAMIGHHDRIGTDVGSDLCILDIDNSLQDQFVLPLLSKLANVIPVERGIELLAGPIRKRRQIIDILGMADDVAEGPPSRAQHGGPP